MLAYHLRQLKAVEFGHADIDQNNRDVRLEQDFERLLGGCGLDQGLVEFGEYDFVARQLAGLVVDEEDLDPLLVFLRLHHLSGAATCAAPPSAALCSRVLRDSRTRRPRGTFPCHPSSPWR